MTLMVEPVAHVDIRKLCSRFPSVSTHIGEKLYRAKATYWALPITPRLSRSTSFASYRSSAPWVTRISERPGYFVYSVGEYRWISRPLWLGAFPAAEMASALWLSTAPFPGSSGEVLGDCMLYSSQFEWWNRAPSSSRAP